MFLDKIHISKNYKGAKIIRGQNPKKYKIRGVKFRILK
jgi:hypothetical protein